MLAALVVLGLIFGLGPAGEIGVSSKPLLAQAQPNRYAANQIRLTDLTTSVQLACDSISVSKSKCWVVPYGASTGARDYVDGTQHYSQLNWNCDTPHTTFSSPTDSTKAYRKAVTTWTNCPGTPTQDFVFSQELDTPCNYIETCSGSSCFTPEGVCEGDAVGYISKTCNANLGWTGYASGTTVLSDEYTTQELIQNTIAALPPYPGTFAGTCSGYGNLSSDETSYTIRRFKYKFTFPTATQSFTINWLERFTPDGGGSPTDTVKWERISIGATESSVHEPPDPSSNGTVTIEDVVAVQIVPGAGVAGVLGDMVPSNNGNEGENHFVSPPNLVTPGGNYLTFQAEGVSATEFENFQWDGGQAVSGDLLKRRVARTSAAKTVLRILRKADRQEMAKLNVWIVSATMIPEKLQKRITPTLSLTAISIGYSFTHVIAPAEILTGEHPALEGAQTVAAPGATNSCGFSLAGGVNRKWDNSRQIRGVISNPNSLPLRCEDWLNSEFPDSNIEGNDDANLTGETNNPYANGGVLTGRDPAFRYWSNNIGAPGNTIEEDLHFREFTRLQIGSLWYRISGWQLWRADFKFIKAVDSSRWQDNGSDSYLDQ